MKRIICLILTFGMIFSVIGSVNVYGRIGVDVNGNPVTNSNIYQPTDDPVYYYQPPVDENGEHDYYGYPMYGDPMDITDEDFFGVWDEYSNTWVIEPKFRYSAYPDMALVEAAAKLGDYETAKYELKEYYLGINNRGDITSNSFTARINTYLDALSRNVYAYSSTTAASIGGFTLPADEFETVELDVTTDVASAKGDYTEFCLALASVDKFYTTAEIYSKDAADPSVRPILRMVVNGVVVEKQVVKDNMVVGGTEGDINYAYDEIMQIQEHGTYDETDSSFGSYDEDTKRAFVVFDLSGLKSTDVVSSAKVIFTGRSIITDETRERFADENGNPYSGKTKEKLIWAIWYMSTAWTEEELAWNTPVINEKQYFSCNDMEAWDFVATATKTKGKAVQFFRSGMIQTLRNGFMKYGDERFAYTSIRQEMALINSIGVDRDVMTSLDISTHLDVESKVFYGLLRSKYMTPEIVTAYLKFIWLMADHLVTVVFGKATNNWATYATAGVYVAIAYFPEFATHDYWYERVLDDNSRCLSVNTLEDGLCIEMSQGYISTILDTFRTPMNIYVQTGHPLPYDEETYQGLYNIIKSGIYTSGGPRFSGFNQSDSSDMAGMGSTKGMYSIWYQTLFADDEEIAYLATNGVKGKLPENPTTMYPIGLKTVMRSSWDGYTALQLSFVNNTSSLVSHYHYDALSFAMFAYGKFLLIDPGYGGDQTSDNGRVWEYNKSPVQHNLVTINDTYDYIHDGVDNHTTLARDSSYSRDFTTNKYNDYQDYICTGYSSSPEMSRSITFMKEQKFYIVSDYAVPNNPNVMNVFAQHWHMYPGANQTVDENFAISSNFNGVNIKVIPLEEGTVDNYEFVDAYYSERSGQKIVNKKTMLLKEKTGNAKFTTLILPVDLDEDFDVVSRSITNTNEGIDDADLNMAYFKITENTSGAENYYYYYHINKPELKPEGGVKVANFTTDASAFVIQLNKNKEIKTVFMVNGSYIKNDDDDNYLVKTKDKTSLSYKISGRYLTVMSSDFETAKDLKDVSIYSPKVLGAYLDDSEVGINVENGIVTFNGTYSSSNNTPPTGGGSGGGGGGGSAPSKPKDDEKQEEDKPKEDVEVVEPSVDVEVNIPDVIAKELDGHWGENEITSLYKAGIVTGDANGLRLKDNISRAEFVALIVRTLELDLSEYSNSFLDVDIKDWHASYIATAYDAGLIGGADGMFRPNDIITREEMCKIIACAINIEYELKKPNFKDIDSISGWALEYVNKAYSLGFINGMDDGTFAPKNTALREQAFIILARIKNFIDGGNIK